VPQIYQLPMLAMRIGNHAQTSQATFRHLQLQNRVQGRLISDA